MALYLHQSRHHIDQLALGSSRIRHSPRHAALVVRISAHTTHLSAVIVNDDGRISSTCVVVVDAASSFSSTPVRNKRVIIVRRGSEQRHSASKLVSTRLAPVRNTMMML